MKEYVKNSFKKSMKERKEYHIYDVPVFLINKFPPSIDANYIFSSVEDSISSKFLRGVEGIYVGNFPELKDRNIQAFNKDGAIYLSSFEDFPDISPDLIVRDIIHEIAHSVETNFYELIYGDFSIEREYVGKKKRIVDLLIGQDYRFHKKIFFSDEFVDELDDFLYKTVGYNKLSVLSAGLFISPYSITSIREYFANAFEEYLEGNTKYVQQISPMVYNKIENLMEIQ
jgi:hypothetical protein